MTTQIPDSSPNPRPSASTRPFLAPNLNRTGRLVRFGGAVGLIMAGVVVFSTSSILAVILWVGGGFVLFEAGRGWCVLRACGIKTRF